jgi:hypothetical protein
MLVVYVCADRNLKCGKFVCDWLRGALSLRYGVADLILHGQVIW